jgi:hypothetical protein
MEPIGRAAVDLRVLQDGPPSSGVRIIGRVYADTYGTPASGAKVLITVPGGSISTTTDQQGIYDLVGLPAGRYSVRLEPGIATMYSHETEQDVKSGEVWGATLFDRPAQPSSR